MRKALSIFSNLRYYSLTSLTQGLLAMEYPLSTLILTGVIASLTGLGIGVLISNWFGSGSREKRKFGQELSDLKDQQRDYQYEVNEHFSETSRLLTTLASSYREVHNHLAKGAADLTSGGPTSAAIHTIPDSTPTRLAETDEPVNNPPLDYAPRSNPNDTGMLSEEFGLEPKVKPNVAGSSTAKNSN